MKNILVKLLEKKVIYVLIAIIFVLLVAATCEGDPSLVCFPVLVLSLIVLFLI